MTMSKQVRAACDRYQRWIDDTIGAAALGPGGDVLGTADAITADVRTTPAELLAAHAVRLERHLRAHGAWPDPNVHVDQAEFAAMPLPVQAEVVRRLWGLVAASGWRPGLVTH